jgi:hypothetical protein
MQAIRLRNEVAESYYQMFHYLEALEEWEVLLPDVRECFGTENIEYGYVLERIWLAASKVPSLPQRSSTSSTNLSRWWRCT